MCSAFPGIYKGGQVVGELIVGGEDREFPLSLCRSSHRVIFGGALLITKFHNTLMRLLSKEEQELCESILSRGSDPNNILQNILDPFLEYARIWVCNISGKPKAKILQEDSLGHKATTSREEEISGAILMAVNLIKLLERDGYIMLLQVLPEKPSEFHFGPGAENQPYVSSDINDDVVKLLVDYSFTRIYVTEEFRVFCANGCIPRSDVQFNQNLELTKQSLDKARTSNWIAIATLIITLLSFVVSIALSLGWRPSFFS